MTKHFSLAAFITILSAILTYYIGLNIYPKLVMNVAMDKISENGKLTNTLQLIPRITPEMQRVVRPSPDLLYSTCVYDLSAGDIEIVVTPTENYYSLSLFQNNTDNFFVENDKTLRGQTRKFILTNRASESNSKNVIISPTNKGIALIRRLASSDEEFEHVLDKRKQDSCKVLS